MKRFIIVFTVFLFSATSLFAKTITVTNSADNGAGTLRQAIADADNGDVIVFADNVTTVYFAEVISIDKNITISGNETNNPIFKNVPTGWTGSLGDTRYFNIYGDIEVTFNHITMKDNSAHCSGGAISNGSKLTLNNCTFNNTKSLYDVGGAISNSGNLIVMNCVFSNCYAAVGGAIGCRGTTTITNSLFIKNYGPNTCNGGAIYVSGGGMMSISNCTFEGNTAMSGAAIMNYGTMTLYNNILWNNKSTFDYDYADVYTNNGNVTAYHNIIGKSNRDLSGNGNIIGQNPLFVGNGNYSLQEGSPAIDKGNNTYLSAGITKDLAGNPRISNGIVDMGAYEYQRVNWCDSVVTALQGRITVLEQENGTLHDSILALLDTNSAMQNNYRILQRENSTLRDSIVVLFNANSTLRRENRTLQNKNRSLENLNTFLEEENEFLYDSIMALLSINSTLQNNNTVLQNENNTLQNENSVLQDSNIVLLDKIDLLQDSIDALLQQLAECEAKDVHSVGLIPENNIQVYPNPVNSSNYELKITNYEWKQGDIVELFDMNGKCMYSARVEAWHAASLQPYIINMSSYKTGTYILRITQRGSEISVTKIMKL